MTYRRSFATAAPTRDDVARVISELLDEIGITWLPGGDETQNFFEDLGFDSFDGYEMVVSIEEAFGLQVNDVDFAELFTVGSVIDAVAGYYTT